MSYTYLMARAPQRHLLILAASAHFAAAAAAAELLRVVPDVYTSAPDRGAPGESPPNARAAIEAALDAGDPAAAMRIATDTLYKHPEDGFCRRLAGYTRRDSRWLTPYQQRQRLRGYAWDTRFGWVKREDLPRYEAGQRPRGRRWLSAAQDARRHDTIDRGWRVRTDRWVVTTNHSLQAAAGLAAELERLFQLWRQLMGGYYLDAETLRSRLAADRPPAPWPRPMRVVFHASKQQYVAALRHKQPRIAQTVGIYFDDLREAHFFAPTPPTDTPGAPDATPIGGGPFRLPPGLLPTLYHEATHQLFQESRRSTKNAGADRGYWLIEGVATAMESLTAADAERSSYRFAHRSAGRLPEARHRLAAGRLVPLEELESLGMLTLQHRDDLPAVYSQMAGLATMLLAADSGRRRPAVVAQLRSLYRGDSRRPTLWRTLGESPREVEHAYRVWLLGTP